MQIGKHGKSREGTGWMKGIKSVIGLPSKVGLAGLPALRIGHAKMARKCSRFGGKSFPNESAPQGRVALPEFKRCPARCVTRPAGRWRSPSKNQPLSQQLLTSNL
jgi:hypothetical protein